MNETRPKSSNAKKANKAKAKARKAPLLVALQEARYGGGVGDTKATTATKKPASKKAEPKDDSDNKAAPKKPAVEKPVAKKKE